MPEGIYPFNVSVEGEQIWHQQDQKESAFLTIPEVQGYIAERDEVNQQTTVLFHYRLASDRDPSEVHVEWYDSTTLAYLDEASPLPGQMGVGWNWFEVMLPTAEFEQAIFVLFATDNRDDQEKEHRLKPALERGLEQGHFVTMTDLAITGLPGDDEFDPGGTVSQNRDHDEENQDAGGNPVPDNRPDAAAGERIVLPDSELLTAQLNLQGEWGLQGTWRLTFPNRIKVWREQQGNWVEVVSGADSAVVTPPQDVDLRIEGMILSGAVNDVPIMAHFTPTQIPPPADDWALLTVVRGDLDVDTDRSGGNPDDAADEVGEDTWTDARGAILLVNCDDDGPPPTPLPPQIPRWPPSRGRGPLSRPRSSACGPFRLLASRWSGDGQG